MKNFNYSISSSGVCNFQDSLSKIIHDPSRMYFDLTIDCVQIKDFTYLREVKYRTSTYFHNIYSHGNDRKLKQKARCLIERLFHHSNGKTNRSNCGKRNIVELGHFS